MTNFASRLIQARNMRKWSPETLSEKSGIPVEVIYGLEKGGNRAAKKFPNLAAVLGVNPEWLATGKQKAIPLEASDTLPTPSFATANSDSFATRLMQTRIERGWSQAELGKRVGKTQGFIHHLESGRNRSTKLSKEIAKQLEVSHDWLISGQGDKACTFTKAHQRLFNAIQALALSEDYIEQLAQVFEAMSHASESHSQPKKRIKRPTEQTFPPSLSNKKQRSRSAKKAA